MIPAKLDQLVRDRAGHRCEYCQMPQAYRRLKFQIDHIIARQHGGGSTAENLSLCCGRCNRHKGPNLSGIDEQTFQMVPLYNPRQDRWADHFRWEGTILVGTTPIGRASVNVLQMNHPDDVAIRMELNKDSGG